MLFRGSNAPLMLNANRFMLNARVVFFLLTRHMHFCLPSLLSNTAIDTWPTVTIDIFIAFLDFFSASGRVSPPRSPRKMVSRPTSPRKIQKHDVSILTELSLLEEDRRTQDEISRLTQLVGTLR